VFPCPVSGASTPGAGVGIRRRGDVPGEPRTPPWPVPPPSAARADSTITRTVPPHGRTGRLPPRAVPRAWPRFACIVQPGRSTSGRADPSPMPWPTGRSILPAMSGARCRDDRRRRLQPRCADGPMATAPPCPRQIQVGGEAAASGQGDARREPSRAHGLAQRLLQRAPDAAGVARRIEMQVKPRATRSATASTPPATPGIPGHIVQALSMSRANSSGRRRAGHRRRPSHPRLSYPGRIPAPMPRLALAE
jgi:hypothetical protein